MNKVLIFLLMIILLFSSIPFFSSQVSAAPTSIIYQAPITIYNTQSSATPSPFQQMIQLNESTYKPHISYTGSTANFEFSYSNYTIIPAWIESNNSGVLTIWLKLYSIPASSSITIYIDFASLPTNLLSSSGTAGIGEAPQLSPTYGEYDDGASVFSLYSNFYDSLAGYYVYNFNGDSNYYVPTPTISPYYSVELLDNSGGVGAYILSPNNISLGNYILQTYWSYSGSADGFSVSLWGDPETIYDGGGGDTPGMFNGLTYHYEFYTAGGGVPPGGDPNAASVFSLTGDNAGTLITGAPAEGEGTYYVYSQIAFYNIGSNSGTVALYSSATTNTSTPNNISPAELYNPAYQSAASFTSIPLSASPILFGAGSGDSTSYVYIYWALMRSYPPNGVMPSVSFGSISYRVTFIESGLPSGYWYVNITGQQSSGPIPSSQSSYSISLPNGSYSYTVSTGNKEYKPSYTGSFTVNGASVSQSISFSEVTYTVTFTESGLPSGATWNVTLNGAKSSSSSSSIVFTEPNGTYSYTIGIYQGYSASPYSGSVTVSGANVNVAITFTQVKYSVTFTESGLPTGISWSVTLNGNTKTSTTSIISFTEPNGTYSFSIASINDYSVSPSLGSITVNGSNMNLAITFTLVTYTVTFTESGLPSGTMWYVNLSNGQSYSGTGITITFSEPNGTYSYTIATANKSYTPNPSSGKFTVNGEPVNVSIIFKFQTYTITFIENGLPSGTNWSVTVNGITKYSTGENITFTLINGTYTYNVNVPSGYIVENGRGEINTWNSGSKIIIKAIQTPNNSISIIPIVVTIIMVIIIGVLINEIRKRKNRK